ncbi:MAG: RelA/SpoT family protein [Flavobacteriaceae bacterium]|nr:RelA/SpoT family protein [Flavobacteriaceae bacterium]
MVYKATIEEEKKEITKRYKNMLTGSYETLSLENKKLIRKAFEVAADAHKEQRRKTGEPYIFHPIAVAKIVANDIGLGAVSIAAALLHDVVEDTHYTIADIEQLFGETIARIVSGLTKIAHLKKDKDASLQAENYRKLLLTLHDDVRVIIIKIADRLHNMQTMDAMPTHKQVKIASETLFIYAPLAHRLGLYNIKTQLEDLGLKYTEPEVYTDISNKITQSKEEQNIYIKSFSKIIKESLIHEKMIFKIIGRPKSIYSIRKKMLNQGVSFDEVYDKFAVRIIYKSSKKEEKINAWKIYSIVTDHFRPNPNRMRDWITQPKSTGYEALHITVMGLKGRWVEVQIRSERMHEIAEKGYAAHFKYKQGNQKESGLENWLNLLKETLESQNTNAIDFIEQFKLNLYAKEIYVFTPNGDIKSLPKDATTVDFAFTIHTEVGMTCRGAKVNGKIVPLSYVLNSGDQVEIIVSKNQKPKASWLNFVKTASAKSKIKTSLKEEHKEIAIHGKEILSRKLRHIKIPFNEKTINELISYFKLKTSLDLFLRFGNGAIENNQLKDFAIQRKNTFYNFFKSRVRKKSVNTNINKDDVTLKYDLLVFGSEEEQLNYKPAQCCNPIPGDSVFGFITVNDGMKIHKLNCPNSIILQASYAYRIKSAKWIDSSQQEHRVVLNLRGLDNDGLLGNVSEIIANSKKVNLYGINIHSNEGYFEGKITVGVNNNDYLKKLIINLKKIDGITKISRAHF